MALCRCNCSCKLFFCSQDTTLFDETGNPRGTTAAICQECNKTWLYHEHKGLIEPGLTLSKQLIHEITHATMSIPLTWPEPEPNILDLMIR